MSATTSLGIVYPTSADPMCYDVNDPTKLRTGLREMADTIEPLYAGWAPTVSDATDRLRVQVRASSVTVATVLTGQSWQIPYDTLVYNDRTPTDLGLVAGLILGVGMWWVELVVNIPGGATGSPGVWQVQCTALGFTDLFDYGAGQQNSMTVAGVCQVLSGTRQVIGIATPPGGSSATVAYSTLSAERMA